MGGEGAIAQDSSSAWGGPDRLEIRKSIFSRIALFVPKVVDQLKELRQFRENYSDVILRLAEPEGTRATVVKLAERG